MGGKRDRNGANVRDQEKAQAEKAVRQAHEDAIEQSARKIKRRNDIVLVAAIIAVALCAWLIISGGFYPGGKPQQSTISGPYAVVQNTEGEYDVLPLSVDTTLRVESSKGYNVVMVRNGKVFVDEADCKNQVCVETGEVGNAGDIIVCLPHQLVVQVVNDPSEASPVQGIVSK